MTTRLADVKIGDTVHVLNMYGTWRIATTLTVVRRTPTRIIARHPNNSTIERSFKVDDGAEVKTRHNQFPSMWERLITADDPAVAELATRDASAAVIRRLHEAAAALPAERRAATNNPEVALQQARDLLAAAQTAVDELTRITTGGQPS